MKLIETTARRVGRVLVGAVFAGAVAATAGVPVSGAAPCSASGLANTASGVLGSAGGYLDAHPGANDALTAAATQPTDVARDNVRGYFISHPNEFLDLQRIVQPIKDLRAQCGISVTPSQIATLLETMG